MASYGPNEHVLWGSAFLARPLWQCPHQITEVYQAVGEFRPRSWLGNSSLVQFLPSRTRVFIYEKCGGDERLLHQLQAVLPANVPGASDNGSAMYAGRKKQGPCWISFWRWLRFVQKSGFPIALLAKLLQLSCYYLRQFIAGGAPPCID